MQNCQSQKGMTLVELLVVVAIIGLLLAVSVPLLRPALASRKTSNAAQVLASAFQQARMKSMQEGRSYGLLLIPYDIAPTVAVQLRLQRSVPSVVNPENIRVVVRDGTIIPCRFNAGNAEWVVLGGADPDRVAVEKLLVPGSMIQFNRIGRWFTIGANFTLAGPYDNLNLPIDPVPNAPTSKDALEYCITSGPTSTWTPQQVMPRGSVVDLAFSGGETLDFEGAPKDDGVGIPPSFKSNDEIIVMFSPAGHVDLLYVNGLPKRVNEMLFFCVGEWDRQVDAGGNSLAEDKKSNLEVPATYWVTIHPKTGEIRIAENAPIPASVTLGGKIHDARKFAREHFFNVGGF